MKKRHFFKISATMLCFLLSLLMTAQEKPKVYVVSNAHFDSQWNWDVQTSIRDYVSKTVYQNLLLLEKYPNYIFNFEGGIKYWWMKEYYPIHFEKIKDYIHQGRWHVTGSSWDATDVNIPFPESFTRNILYGQMFYQDEFGVRGTDIFIPDCFGFGWILPTIAAHSGLIGFSTQKLQWRTNPFFENRAKIPFEIGLWKGVDGSQIMLVADGRNYTTRWSAHDLSRDSSLIRYATQSPLKTVYHYYGVGDTGGAPTLESVLSVEMGLKGDGPIKIISATSDQLYKDYLPFDKHPELPTYTGELLMDVHGTGCYTSQAAMKLYNRKNEQLGDLAERAAVVADWMGVQKYPGESLTESWRRFIWHQFHDDLTGTSLPRAYEFSWNDELLSQKQFAQILTASTGAVSNMLNTQVKGTPLVINNSISRPVKDILEINIDKSSSVKQAGVFDESGKPVPSQWVAGTDGNKLLIASDVKPVSYTVYELRAGGSTKVSALKVTNNTIENSIYKVTLDSNGNISSIIDKRFDNRELVKSGKSIRLALLTPNPSNQWPAWEIMKTTVDQTPVDIIESVATKIVENGPVRASLCIERKYGESTFRQYIRLTEGGQDDRIDVVNEINWQTPSALLKAEFPFNIDNEAATYDIGIGTVERKNNSVTAYEVPAQYWADLTAKDGSYGISVMNNSKVGWDKPDNNTLRLTLLHTPETQNRYAYQNIQDFGYHTLTYSIMGHRGNYVEAQTVAKAEILNRPLTAFFTGKHNGKAGRSFSFLQTSDDRMMVKALKKAEKSNDYVIRLYETTGKAVNDFTVTFASDIEIAHVLNGVEDVTGNAVFSGNKLTVNATPYSIHTFSVRLKPGASTGALPQSTPVVLNYNIKAASYNAYRSDANIDGKGYSYAAELLPETINASGIEFKLGDPVLENAIRCAGDTIILPQNGQYNKLYFLASSIMGDIITTFLVDDKPYEFVIPYYSGFIGQWGHTGHTQGFFKPAEVAYTGTHRHLSSGNVDAPYEFTYMFKFGIDIPKNAKKLILPDDSKILFFAATLAANENDNLTPAVDLVSTALKAEDLVPYSNARRNLIKNKPIIAKSTPDAPATNVNPNARGGAPNGVGGRGGALGVGSRPEAAIDGNINTMWVDSGENGTPYIEVDLEKESAIKGWFIYHGASTGRNNFAAQEYNLQVKKNLNDAWQTVDVVKENTESETNRLLAAPVAARYVRLNILKGAEVTQGGQGGRGGGAGGQSGIRIAEFEIY